MPTLAELMERDNVEAHWFWVTSHDVGPYAEEEGFDVVFTVDTNYIVGGGCRQRRTLYVQDVRTNRALSRRENGGDIVTGDPVGELAELLQNASGIDSLPTFEEWAREYYSGANVPAWEQYATFENNTRIRNRMRCWLGDMYDEYVKAAAED